MFPYVNGIVSVKVIYYLLKVIYHVFNRMSFKYNKVIVIAPVGSYRFDIKLTGFIAVNDSKLK